MACPLLALKALVWHANWLGVSKARFIGCKSIHPKGRLNCTQVHNGSPVGYKAN